MLDASQGGLLELKLTLFGCDRYIVLLRLALMLYILPYFSCMRVTKLYVNRPLSYYNIYQPCFDLLFLSSLDKQIELRLVVCPFGTYTETI